MCFRSDEFFDFYENYGIALSYSSPYHPQGNGQAKSSNNFFLKIIKRILGNNKKAWDLKLVLAVWANRVTVKKSIGFAPYELLYGKGARLPLSNLLLVYKFVTEEVSEEVNFMEDRLMALAELDECRREAQERNLQRQQMVKAFHDKKACDRSFKEGEWVLKWNAKDQDKGKHGKFDALWLEPFIISKKGG
ncbi:uncharacterized protein LOC131045360 [Cryptomeria japonica]|uniref:uncharacterized protein LOC131045360 n=1 Tax=Cryptomeria japonica TaxID=3369 RepID=UPI0027DA23CD|nr:uncharacterized protein LOC131045360 [Cryptomeria japonica]